MNSHQKRKMPDSPSGLAESSATRRRLDKTPILTLVSDILDAEIQAHLDDAVYSESDEPDDLNRATFLLTNVVQYSHETLSSQYATTGNAKRLLKEYPGLMEMLKAAWAKKSFRDIRRLRESHRLLSSTEMRNLARNSPV